MALHCVAAHVWPELHLPIHTLFLWPIGLPFIIFTVLSIKYKTDLPIQQLHLCIMYCIMLYMGQNSEKNC